VLRPGDGVATLSLRTVVADTAALDARNLQRTMMKGLFGYAALLGAAAALWFWLRRRRLDRRT
jgi:hypothetical protein